MPQHMPQHRGILEAINEKSYMKIAYIVGQNKAVGINLDLDVPDKDDITYLHYACFTGDESVVNYLLEEGAKINAVDKLGWIPLHGAILSDNVNLVKLLCQKGANVKVNETFNVGLTPLYTACKQGNEEMVSCLLDHGADPKVIDQNRCTISEILEEDCAASHIFRRQVQKRTNI